MAGGETEIAFRAAHTLKGTSANLGIQSLYTLSSEMTELLRAGKRADAEAALPKLEAEYTRVCALLAELS